MSRATLVLLICASSAVGFLLGRHSVAVPPAAPATPPGLDKPRPAPGTRGLELARLRRLAVRVGADDTVGNARKDVESAVRNRLAAAGYVIVPDGEPSDAVVQVRIEGFHFSAHDEHGVGSEIHVVAPHAVEIDGLVRTISHDLWQADAMRLARKERLDAEALALSEELLQHLLGAFDRAREGR